MARLEDMLPPGEFVRWKSPKRAWWRFSGPTLAVTEAHVLWVGDGGGKIALRDIAAIDAEEGGDTVTLYSANGETNRIEDIGGDVEGAARAAGRPARVWRECKSRSAVLARRWRMHIGGIVAGAAAGGTFLLVAELLGSDTIRGLSGAAVAGGSGLAAHIFASAAKRTLPHLLVGHRLSGEDRRDFVGWMTDLRWQGVKPDGADDDRVPRSALERWAMRKAYGEIPDIGEREPEVLIPGEIPESR